jgi:membrane protein
LQQFLARGVWQQEVQAAPRWQQPWLRLTRFGWSVYKGFVANACLLHASALTYYTLFAIVPMLALGLALARVFGGEEIARREIHAHVIGLFAPEGAPVGATNAAPVAVPDVNDEATRMSQEFVARLVSVEDKLFQQVNCLSLGTLGGMGLIGLLWMVVSMLQRVEESFNAVWGIAQGRSAWRCFADYLSVVMILPLLAVAASTVPVMDVLARNALVAGLPADSLRTVVGSLWVKQGIVLGFTTLAFAFLFLFMPNTRVRLLPAFVGGLITAVCFMTWLRICTLMQVGIVKYSLIYGGFALLPILLAWIYVSWQIVMLGALVTCTLQYGSVCPTDRMGRPISPRSRLLLALELCAGTIRAMREQGVALDAESFIQARQLPARLTRALLDDLVRAGLLAEVTGQQGRYLLCRDPAQLTVAEVARYVWEDGLSPAELGLHHLDLAVVAAEQSLASELARTLAQPVVGK